jgi:hypothetical protein
MEIQLKGFQDKFIFSKARFPALVAAVGTGKTLCGIMRMMNLMEESKDNLGIIVRREFTDLRDSTIKDFERYTGLKVGSDKEVRLPNSSLIMFRHGDEINVLKNINAGAILIEQAEEFETDETFTFLRDRLRRQEAKQRSLFIIANTNGHNWIYKLWKGQADPAFDLTEATTFDNADVLPEDYIADLKKMELTHPEHYRRYVMNSWDDVDTVDVIIRPEWIRKSYEKDVFIRFPVRKIISIDVARYGNDKTVFYAIEHAGDVYRIIEKQERSKENTMETVGWAIKFGEKLGINAYAVDEIGVGAGVVDRLDELKKEVVPINSSEQAGNPDKFYNRRAEIYANAAEIFQEGRIETLENDEDGKEQLGWARYKSIKSNGKLQVEAKEDIKKRYLRSPDNADAIVNAIWAVPQVSVVRTDRYNKNIKISRFNSETV